MTTSQKALRLTTLLGATAASIAAISATTQAEPSPPSAQPAAARAAAQSPGAASFAVFRRAAQPGDAMPEAVRTMLAPTAEREQADLDDARAVAPLGLGTVWAIPGVRGICLAIPDPVDGFGVNCKPYELAAAGQLWAALVGGAGQSVGDVRMALFLPDDAHGVTAVALDGCARTLDASGNVVVADLASSARVEFTDASGARRSTEIPGTPPELVRDR